MPSKMGTCRLPAWPCSWGGGVGGGVGVLLRGEAVCLVRCLLSSAATMEAVELPLTALAGS